jgi:hypothetical protein
MVADPPARPPRLARDHTNDGGTVVGVSPVFAPRIGPLPGRVSGSGWSVLGFPCVLIPLVGLKGGAGHHPGRREHGLARGTGADQREFLGATLRSRWGTQGESGQFLKQLIHRLIYELRGKLDYDLLRIVLAGAPSVAAPARTMRRGEAGPSKPPYASSRLGRRDTGAHGSRIDWTVSHMGWKVACRSLCENQ